ncbi:MAG: aldose 1-epimerase family protein [Devosia sp.]
MTTTDYSFGRLQPVSQAAHDVGLTQQVMSADLVVREDGRARGVRCVLLQNDRVSLEVLVDRGLDIGRARIEQIPMAWASPVGVVAPSLGEARGSEFLRSFHGGLLTTCGLDHFGQPSDRDASRFNYEPRPSEHLPMHGRASGIPATLSAYGVIEKDGELEAFVAGTVAQVAVFGEHLVLSRRISLRHGSTEVRIEDSVTNHGYAPSPLAVMYHVNVGWPVFAPGAKIVVGGEPLSGDRPPDGILPPVAGTQQVVTIYATTPDSTGNGSAEIVNPHLAHECAGGVRLRWDAKAMPTLVRWQLANAAGHYVLGLEPSTALTVRGDGVLVFPTLTPGETRHLGLTIELLKFAAPSAGQSPAR